jgi:hypothetical protein
MPDSYEQSGLSPTGGEVLTMVRRETNEKVMFGPNTARPIGVSQGPE